MQFLRTLFWVVLAIVAAIFSMNNWRPVRVDLWANLAADVKLPVLIFGAYFAGLVPPLAWHRISRWRYRRRLSEAERSLTEARTAEIVTPVTTPAPPIAVEPAASVSPASPPPALP